MPEQDRISAYFALSTTIRDVRRVLAKLAALREELGGDDDLGAPVIDPITADLQKMLARLERARSAPLHHVSVN